jgi:conjugative relaxase-like TrwC/TraI family protein
MTVSYKKSGAGGGSYYTNCMTPEGAPGYGVDDYYTGSAKEPPGIWYIGPDSNGQRSTRLGVADGQQFQTASSENEIADVEKFSRLIAGRHSIEDSPLVKNVDSPDRIAFHDWTLSAPKSVSVIWSQAHAELKAEIESAQLESSRTFLNFMSTKSQIRQGKDGVIKLDTPLLGALFGHGSSRENDPQLHTHSVMFNMGEGPDRVNALETRAMMKWTGTAASLYHADLAWRMRGLGFKIERKEKIFEIAGVPAQAIEHFSKRRAQIVAAVEKRQVDLGMNADAENAARGLLAKVAIETRTEKNELTREQLEVLWRGEGTKMGFTSAEVQALITHEEQRELTQNELSEVAISAVDELTQTHTLFSEPALLTAVAVRLQGLAPTVQIHQAVAQLKEHQLVRTTIAETGEEVFSTHEMLGIERHMLDLAVRRGGAHVLSDVELPDTLDDEQRVAARAACHDNNAVTVIEGAAGAGKTFTMAATARAYEGAGYQVTGLATSWAAALTLRDSARLDDSCAIAGWINDVRSGKQTIDDKSMLIIDEAGQVGARDMHHLLELAERAGAKVVLLGDTLQQKAVAAGDPLRCIASKIGSSLIGKIRRQRDEAQRESVHQFFAGDASNGLKVYLQAGAVKVSRSDSETNRQMIEAWTASRLINDNKTHLMIAVERKSVIELNRLAHEHLRTSGDLEEGIWVKNMDCADTSKRVEFSVGDEAALRINDREQDVFNGMRGRIESINERVIKMRTETGLVEIDVDAQKWQYRASGLALQHAYAMTIYASQGLAVDVALMKDSIALNRVSVGVAMSRHRDSCTVFVDAQARHKAAMLRLAADDWKPLREYRDEECLADVAASWSWASNKDSTLDHGAWVTAQGLPVAARDEADILKIQRNADLLRTEIERIRQKSKTGQAGIELPFMRNKHYEVPSPEVSLEAMVCGVEALQADDIHDDVIKNAIRSGALTFNEDGEPVFCAKNSKGGIVRRTQDRQEREQLGRAAFAPVLEGDQDKVTVVRTGREALHLKSLELRNEATPSTVIVSGGNERVLGMPAVREQIQRSAGMPAREDKKPIEAGCEPYIVEESRKAAAEVQAEQALQLARRERIRML